MNFIKHVKVLYNTFLEHSNETHKNIIQALIIKMAGLETDLGLMLAELCILSATGTWLDEWGSWFGVHRRKNEKDIEYRERIIISVKAPKSTIPALKEHAVNFLNYEYDNGYQNKYTADDIVIFEPWTKLSIFSHKGTLSGTHRFPDGEYWRRNIIDISIPEDVTKEFIDMINHIKAAGVKISYTVDVFRYGVFTDYNPLAVNLSNTAIELDYYIFRTGEGILLSGSMPYWGIPRVTGTKSLSGKRVIWNDISHLSEIPPVNMLRDWETSYLFRNGSMLDIPLKKKFHYTYGAWDWHSPVKTLNDALERFHGFTVGEICEMESANRYGCDILSVQEGALSGNKLWYYITIKSAEDLPEFERNRLMQPVQREILFMSPHIMSVQSRLSNNVVLSGAFEDTGLFKSHHDTVDTKFSVFNSFNIKKAESAIITEIDLFKYRESKSLSGKRNVWNENLLRFLLFNKEETEPPAADSVVETALYAENLEQYYHNDSSISIETGFSVRVQGCTAEKTSSLNLMVTDMLNWHSPLITVNDLLSFYGNVTVDEACKGLRYSYPCV